MISAGHYLLNRTFPFTPQHFYQKKKNLHINIVALCSVFYHRFCHSVEDLSCFLLQCPSVLCYYCLLVWQTCCWSQWDSGMNSFSYTTGFELSSECMASSSALMEKQNNCPKCCQLHFFGVFFQSHSKYFYV